MFIQTTRYYQTVVSFG